MTICARSPLRIDFVGMTDYRPACRAFGGSIVNAPINKYIYATVRLRDDGRFVFDAPDQNGLVIEAEDCGQLDGKGELGLAQHIVKTFAPDFGMSITTYSELPGGAGLGSSSAVATCLIAALNALTGYKLTSYEIAEAAIAAEAAALDVEYGWQDQYSPVTDAWIKYMRWWPASSGRGLEVNRLPLTRGQMAELEKSLVVCFTGKSRPAGDILAKVAEGFRQQDPVVVESLQGMSTCADDIRVALLAGQSERLGELLTRVWELHKRLHPDVTNELLERMYATAMAHGALGGRVCGAGGGGTMLFFCESGREYAVKRALEQEGGRVLDFSFANEGVQVWQSNGGGLAGAV